MRYKKGIAGAVSVVLLILVGIAAVAFIAVFVNIFLQSASEKTEAENAIKGKY